MKEEKLINAAMIFARADFGSHVRIAPIDIHPESFELNEI